MTITTAMHLASAAEPTQHFDHSHSRWTHVSSIFKWYGEDFEKASGSVQAFVAPRIAPHNKEVLKKIHAAKLNFLVYDWSLNGS